MISPFRQDSYNYTRRIIRVSRGHWNRHPCMWTKQIIWTHRTHSSGRISTPGVPFRDGRRFCPSVCSVGGQRFSTCFPRRPAFAEILSSLISVRNIATRRGSWRKSSKKKKKIRKTEKSRKDSARPEGGANRRFASRTIFDPCSCADGRKSRILLCTILYYSIRTTSHARTADP